MRRRVLHALVSLDCPFPHTLCAPRSLDVPGLQVGANIKLDGAGHGVAVAGQRCALSLVRAFVKNPAVCPDAKCVTTAKLLKFLVD